MTVKAEAGSGRYTVTDGPFDSYGSTTVPLHTPHGPLTLHFTNGGHVYADSNYQVREYDSGPSLNATAECFTWRGADVIGSEHFYADAGWMPHGQDGHFAGRGRSITAKMTAEIITYWSAVIARYAAEHPRIPAHAEFRDRVLAMGKAATAVREAEEALRGLRADHAKIRRQVHRAFAAEHALLGSGGPRPYPDMQSHYASGYVIELEQDAARTEHERRNAQMSSAFLADGLAGS